MAETAAVPHHELPAVRGQIRRLLSARNLIVVLVVVGDRLPGARPARVPVLDDVRPARPATLANFRQRLLAVGLGTMALNSLEFAFGSSALAIVLGTVLAYLIVRTDVPFKPLMFAASLVPLIIPGILHTIAWILHRQPADRDLNTWVIEPLDGGHPFNVFSIPGMIVVEGIHLSPLVFLLMVAAFRSMDPSLEESAIMSGASLPTVFRRVTLPLVRPALYAAILIMVVRGLESFEVPAVLGLPAHIWVFTSQIWMALNDAIPNYGKAGAYAMSLLFLTTIGILLVLAALENARSFQTVTGKGFRPHPVPLGRWRCRRPCSSWSTSASASCCRCSCSSTRPRSRTTRRRRTTPSRT